MQGSVNDGNPSKASVRPAAARVVGLLPTLLGYAMAETTVYGLLLQALHAHLHVHVVEVRDLIPHRYGDTGE